MGMRHPRARLLGPVSFPLRSWSVQPCGDRLGRSPPALNRLSEPSLSDGAIAFRADNGASSEIFLLRHGELHRITYNATADSHPCLSGAYIAWDNDPPACYPWPCTPEDSEIWFWNGYGAWQVTDNDVEDAYPSLYELTIAWQSDGNIVYATIPDPEWGMALNPTIVAEGGRPSLWSNKIAYVASDGHDTEIFLYDIASAEILQITDNEYNDRDVCLYEGTLVWQGYDGNDTETFYWDRKTIQQLTDNDIPDTEPSLWGTGLNTTIAYVEWQYTPPFSLTSRIICARPAATVAPGPGPGEMTVTWPSLEGETYRLEYSDDLVNWRIAADSVPSAGYGTTSWTDAEITRPAPAPSAVSRRFYRIAENP